ncbi:DUF6479 family protein [Streptomyces cavernae]|uniref:DUF6479 family protein n=1 Tax=Streptomyces cavernae TaxID=2259034 RepID=UPI000FEB7AA8|nr:DUF6479 family protein [Streptomyces cavernae]
MTAQSLEVAATEGLVGGVFPLLAGIVVTIGLIWAVRLGIRVRRREPAPPRPEEQPRLPESGPVLEVSEMREPDEVPKAQNESERLTPHELHGLGNVRSRRSDDQKRPRWSPGSSGGFGSGGAGRT